LIVGAFGDRAVDVFMGNSVDRAATYQRAWTRHRSRRSPEHEGAHRFKAKSKVQRMLQEEIALLEEGDEMKNEKMKNEMTTADYSAS
jgi:hypothetical protein